MDRVSLRLEFGAMETPMTTPTTEFQRRLLQVQRLRTEALYAVHAADRAFVLKGWEDPVYVGAREALDDVLVALAEAKWTFGRLDGTYLGFAAPHADKRQAMLDAEAGFLAVVEACGSIKKACEQGRVPARMGGPVLELRNEVLFASGIPQVPTICPIVVLQGASRDMGRQYVEQVIEIYGAWIFQQQAAAAFNAKELEEISKWTEQLLKYTPEIEAFALGMCEGAARSGLPLSREQALAIWTGKQPPAKDPRPMAFALNSESGDDSRVTAAYLGVAASTPTDSDMCSGICAWGRGTSDGSLVAGSSTDHDCTFMATIVAFPDEGFPFIYTPFSANGSVPVLGNFHFGGHPGMNGAGLAYVHHAGANTGEPMSEWGYGVRRGPTTLHALQFCSSAAAALEQEQRYPVGDAGISLGTAGGLYADRHFGCAVEARPGAPDSRNPIVRTHSYDALGNSYDFLYANNNALAPQSAHLNVPPPGGYQYSLAGGWYTRDWAEINADPGPKAFRRHNTRSSEGRNRYAYRMMMQGYGRIDLSYMAMVYRQSGEVPEGSLADQRRSWEAGEPWNSSTAHRGNAFTALMKPSSADGIYCGCVGPANRAVQVRGPEHGYRYHDETNAFWELRLRGNPKAVAAAALEQAQVDLAEARRLADAAGAAHAGAHMFAKWLAQSTEHLRQAQQLHAQAYSTKDDSNLAVISRCLRAGTRAQVRARQVIEALNPPADSPSRLPR